MNRISVVVVSDAGGESESVGWVVDASGSNHTLVAGVQIVLLLPAQPVQLWLAMSHETRRPRDMT